MNTSQHSPALAKYDRAGIAIVVAAAGVILLFLFGCGRPIIDKPAKTFAAPPALPAIAPAAKQTATDAGAALKAFDGFVVYTRQFLGDAADTLASFDTAASKAREPIAATTQSAAATVAAAGAKDAENAQLRTQLVGANGTIATQNATIAARDATIAQQKGEFQTKVKVYAAVLGGLTAIAIILCIVVLKAVKTAITVGIAGGVGVAFLLSLGWFDANKGWILLGALVLVALLFVAEVVAHVIRGATFEQAIATTLTTSPLAYISSLASPPALAGK